MSFKKLSTNENHKFNFHYEFGDKKYDRELMIGSTYNNCI